MRFHFLIKMNSVEKTTWIFKPDTWNNQLSKLRNCMCMSIEHPFPISKNSRKVRICDPAKITILARAEATHLPVAITDAPLYSSARAHSKVHYCSSEMRESCRTQYANEKERKGSRAVSPAIRFELHLIWEERDERLKCFARRRSIISCEICPLFLFILL